MDLHENIPRLYTAIAQCMSCFLYGFLLPTKITKGKRIFLSLLFVVVQSTLLILTKDMYIYFWFPVMMSAAGIMFLYLFILNDCGKLEAIYVALKAFLLAEFIASLEWQIDTYITTILNMKETGNLFLVFVVYLPVLAMVFLIEKTHMKNGIAYDVTLKELISVSFIVLSTFAFSNLSYLAPNTPFSGGGSAEIFNIRTIIDFGGLAILYAYQNRIYELQLEKSVLSMDQVLQSHYDNYRNYSESMEMIHIKYHDLKHQLEGLKAEKSPENREKWIHSIEEELQDFRPEIESGNYILDTIISGKMRRCKKLNIRFTCVAKGEILNFLHVTDLCNIFGNALDNSIEGVALLDDPEKRWIHLRVFSKCGFVYISVENSCTQRVTIKNGYPVTTKQDGFNHGYGIRSIDYTVKKYQGKLLYTSEEDSFEMQMIFPMKL